MDATRLDSDVIALELGEPQAEPLLGIEGLLFELPGVLYEATVWRRWLLRLLHRMGLGTPYEAFYETWENDYLGDVYAGRRSLGEALAAYLTSLEMSHTLIEEVVAAAAAQRKVLESDPRPLSGVIATLERLRAQGLYLAVSTDSDLPGGRLRELLARLGVADCFGHVVSSHDLRTTKPEPVCYLAAVTAMGLVPQRVAFVGCRKAHLIGAKAAGIRTIGLGSEPGEFADRCAARFDCLPSLVVGAGKRRAAS